LKLHHVVSGLKDAISIEGLLNNIWIDHCEFYRDWSADKDYYDGLVDIKRGVEYVTISNCYFHDHHKVSLVGYSDSDVGERYITYAFNRFEKVGSRLPSFRFGKAHIYGNYFKDVSVSGINL
jgi:pectate lyase